MKQSEKTGPHGIVYHDGCWGRGVSEVRGRGEDGGMKGEMKMEDGGGGRRKEQGKVENKKRRKEEEGKGRTGGNEERGGHGGR